MNELATWSLDDGIALLTIDNPPVNAISQGVRAALLEGVQRAEEDETVKALVIACAGRTFFAGADISEFGKPASGPSLPDVIDAVGGCAKPVVAAIHGTALGGGAEIAMAAHYRVAAADAKLGLPEVKLGLMPGARGTQLLPRLVGVEKALEIIALGDPVGARAAHGAGLVDEVVDGDLLAAAIGHACKIADEPPLRTGERPVVPVEEAVYSDFAKNNARRFKGLNAPGAIIAAIRDAAELSFEDGAAREREAFVRLRDGPQSAALRHAFFATRKAAKVPELEGVEPRPVKRVGVIGAGTMGSGIATALLVAGYSVTLYEREQAALDRGAATIRKTIGKNVESGRMKQEAADAALAALTPVLEMEELSQADLIIEAAFETMEVKRDIFSRLDGIAKRGAVLATNTSYLDIDEIAAATSRPQDVLGLHFFSPAHIMKLLEIVRGADTAPDALATGFALAKKLRKVPVLAGNAYGFIGNRMLAVRRAQAEQMVVEGASPEQVDNVLEGFGFPMGPLRVGDLAGLDLGWSAETSTGATIRERLNEAGRRGQKAGAGFYDYDEARKPRPSPEAEAIIERFARDQGIARRDFSDAEILDRLLWPMVDEGAKLLAEGIAQRESDIDVVWLNGYGWPAHTGGPMFHARLTGLPEVVRRLGAMDYPVSDALASMAKEQRQSA